MINAAISIATGFIIGIGYGLSFLVMKARPLYLGNAQSIWKASIPSIARIALFALILFYVLHIKSLDSILVLVPFLITFWLTVLASKKYYD